jgi:hypothetical protein
MSVPYHDSDVKCAGASPGGSSMTRGQAQEITTRLRTIREVVRQEIDRARGQATRRAQWQLHRFFEGAGWKAMDYASYEKWAEAEGFQNSRAWFYKLVKNVEFNIQYHCCPLPDDKRFFETGIYPDGRRVIPESKSCEITKLPREKWRPVYDEALRVAQDRVYTGRAAKFHTGKLTVKIVKEVVQRHITSGVPVEPEETSGDWQIKVARLARKNGERRVVLDSFTQTICIADHTGSPEINLVGDEAFRIACAYLKIAPPEKLAILKSQISMGGK